MLRITDQMNSMTAGNNLARIQYRLNVRQQEASSGLRINQASDDPTGAATLVRTDNEIQTTNQCQNNITRSLGQLNTADTTLESVTDLLSQAHDLALAMANGSATATDRTRAAQEIQGIREQILDLANTQYDGIYIFNGYGTDVAPFDNAGNWVGDTNVRQVLVTPQQVADVSINGSEVFLGPGGRDVLNDLAVLNANLSANDVDAIKQSAVNLDQDQKTIITSRAKVGALMVRLNNLDSWSSNRILQLQEDRSKTADIDTIKAMTELADAQQALNSTLQVSARMLSQLTLVDKL